MKRFVIVAAFAASSLVVPGYVFAQSQTDQSGSGQSGQSGQTDQGGMQGQTGTTGTQAPGASSKSSAKAGADATFLKKAAEGGLAEVELGKLATQNASSDAVKKFGQQMVDDHTKANQQVQDAASKKGVTLPTELSPKDKATLDRLQKLSGPHFDRAYMSDMVKDHTKDVSEFQKEAKSGSDPDVKQLASSILPTLEEHLNRAKSVDGEVKGSSKSQSKSSTGVSK